MDTLTFSSLDHLHAIATRFCGADGRLSIRPFGNGNINKTYLVTPADAGVPFLLQRLNTAVFAEPERVMQNIVAIAADIERRLESRDGGFSRRWEVPHVLQTHDGAPFHRAADGGFWRALRLIDGATTLETVADAETALEVGRALGTFHALISELPIEALHDTLPGFHVTPGYMRLLDEAPNPPYAGDTSEWRLDAPPPPGAEEALLRAWCGFYVAQRRGWAGDLEGAYAAGQLRLRPIHGDPKVNNMLFDAAGGAAIAMIDWDTVKPGLVHYDIGDCLRSACNPVGEEVADWRTVSFDLDLADAVLTGYLADARAFFDAADFDYVPEAARLIAFELGVRFYTDHLVGNTYFNVAYEGQNLHRALVQLCLAEQIHQNLGALRAIVDGLR